MSPLGIKSYQQKKGRISPMILYGKQVCLYALEQHPKTVRTIYIEKHGILPQPLFHAYHDKIKFIESKWAQAMAKGGNHQGILIEISPFEQTTFEVIKMSRFVVVLDGLTDTGNIGAIVRSAYALGVDGIIASGVKQLNFAAIARTSSGALLDMPFLVTESVLDQLNELKQKGFVIYGATMDGKPLQSYQFAPLRVLVVGSEGSGLSKKITSKLDACISIEMKHGFDSLNVSAATAILVYAMHHTIT